MQHLEASVALPLNAEALWRSVCRLEGINFELGPIIRMTEPRRLRGRTIADLEPGDELGRSWLLLGGLIPVDYDDIGIAEIEPCRFLERSTMLSMSVWEHERTIVPAAGGCRVTDRLGFELREPLRSIPGAERLATAIVGALFRHRHRRLAKLHGPSPSHRGDTNTR